LVFVHTRIEAVWREKRGGAWPETMRKKRLRDRDTPVRKERSGLIHAPWKKKKRTKQAKTRVWSKNPKEEELNKNKIQ